MSDNDGLELNNIPELSFEFFPPRSPSGSENLMKVHGELDKFEPHFVSVTYGAGGSTQEGTFDAVKNMLATGSSTAPHITGVCSSGDDIKSTIQGYLELGVKRLVVLRGDLPGGMVERGHFKFAEQLVQFVRDEFAEELHLEVAAYPDFHPESASPSTDIQYLKRKFDAGADSAITQYFYNADSYFSFVEEAQRAGISAPIVPGVMPIINYATLTRFSDACGAEIPRWIRARLEQYQHDEPSLKAFGLDVVTHLCLDLLDNDVPGLHFYTLNKTEPVQEICKRIGFQQQP
ncbi:MAG: methylenetetrahydrofolate reductase (NADPH) [Arenicella sp.]